METPSTNREKLAADLNRRQHFRIECEVVASFEVPSTGERGEVRVANIGLGGARADFPVQICEPGRVTLTLPQVPGAEPLTISCEVAWSVADREAGPFPTGLQFSIPEEAVKERLSEYLTRLMETAPNDVPGADAV